MVFGGGPIKNIAHRHFWKTAFLLAVVLAGLWAWHFYKIRYDVRAEQERKQFEARHSTMQSGGILQQRAIHP